ncbi:hypothetical protein CC86DRAFT_328720 [Ophiobolus disseminans]|uniref:Uncharacterized protein n=1 Tax=Ophiobolus disseminans TaxID=1469910 RepID=A0A6A6ZQN6_9PLEO|nr:hypothetical protein CC86DRAFT_328720 [Ophiobolus disseminans]
MPIPTMNAPVKHRIHGDRANEGISGQQFNEESKNHEQPPGSITNDQRHSILRLHALPPPHQGELDGPKRRSLLPQPGQPRYSSHQRDSSVTKTDTSSQPMIPGRLRPRSLYQTGTTQSSQSRKDDKTASTHPLHPPNSMTKQAEPQTAALGRSRSLRRPGVPIQSAQSTTNITYNRTQSTSNALAPSRESSNAIVAGERPRSLLLAPSSTMRPNSITSDSASTASRASARLAGMNRPASVKMTAEISGGGTSGRSVSRPDDPAGAQPRRREFLKEGTTKTAKPAFTTLQQHFTPRKSGKAPTSTFLQPAPAPGASTLSPEIISLQSELLQLHLLHKTSAKVSQQWDLNARSGLRERFEEVASLHQAMLEYERAGQEQKNVQALLGWSAEMSSVGLIACIQILSGPLHELPLLVEPGGRFQRLVGEFGSWISRVEHIWSDRTCSTTDNSNLDYVEGLGDMWKGENVALIRKVTSFARDLDQVRQPSSASSIASIVSTCKALLKGLSDELHMMQVVEADVVHKEKEWVEACVQAIARDAGLQSINVDTDAAAWRM